jgi:toxin ParE1/3/4
MIADFDVRLTRGAEIDLEALHGYVKDNRSVEQADSLLDRLLAAIETLETFPLRGSVPKELGALGIREFRQILVEPYRLIYRLSGKTVFVMVIADGRRDTQALLERRLLGS